MAVVTAGTEPQARWATTGPAPPQGNIRLLPLRQGDGSAYFHGEKAKSGSPPTYALDARPQIP
jgi:hypothetical protein